MPKSKARQKQRPNYAKRVERKLRMAENLNPFLKKYLSKLETENEQLKNDPNTIVGQLIPQMRDAINQNKRLSVLTAAILDSQGGSVSLPKAALESFENKLLNIKWAVPEGVEDVKDADTFIFTYEAKEQEPPPDAPSVTITPNDVPSEDSVKTEDREQKAARLIEASGKSVHASDCATSVAPAEEPGPCDCDVPQPVL